MNSPTRNFHVNLTLVGKYDVSKRTTTTKATTEITVTFRHVSEQPTRPVIYDAQGREVTGVGGPFLEGYNLALTCQVSGGNHAFHRSRVRLSLRCIAQVSIIRVYKLGNRSRSHYRLMDEISAGIDPQVDPGRR